MSLCLLLLLILLAVVLLGFAALRSFGRLFCSLSLGSGSLSPDCRLFFLYSGLCSRSCLFLCDRLFGSSLFRSSVLLVSLSSRFFSFFVLLSGRLLFLRLRSCFCGSLFLFGARFVRGREILVKVLYLVELCVMLKYFVHFLLCKS